MFRQIADLHAQVGRHVREHAKLASGVNKTYWHIVLSRVAADLKRRGVE
jgi:hypothetical protein